MLNKLIFLILGLALFSNFVLAQDITYQEDVAKGGIMPDSILYPIDMAFERITEIFSENAKLNHAMERLSEVKVMVQQNKIEHTEKARIKFEEIRLRMINQTRVEKIKSFMDNLGQKISAIASVKGKLNETQKEEIKGLILEHQTQMKNEIETINDFVLNITGRCQALYTKNNLEIPICVGKWEIQKKVCNWRCD